MQLRLSISFLKQYLAKIKIVTISSGTSVSTMPAVRLGYPAYCKSNSKSFFFSSPKRSARLCSLPNLLFNAYRGPLPAVKRSQCDVNYSYLSSAQIKNNWNYTSTPPMFLFLCTPWCAQEQFYFRQIMESLAVKLYPLFITSLLQPKIVPNHAFSYSLHLCWANRNV